MDDPAPNVPPIGAVVVAGDEETRVLMRGLVRLHGGEVLGEADGATQALEVVGRHPPTLVVLDVNLAEGSAQALLRELKQRAPAARLVLIAPAPRPGEPPRAPAGADATVHRPFKIREFTAALGLPP